MCLAVNQADKETVMRRMQEWAGRSLLFDEWTAGERLQAHAFPRLPLLLADKQVELGVWGLVPSHLTDPARAEELRRMTFNARIETVFEKPSFRAAAPRQRCLLPVNAFWEYQHLDRSGQLDPAGKVTKPYLVHLNDDNVMFLAGLWSDWNGLRTFTIVTKPANTLMNRIHNAKQRMPVIVRPRDGERWLAGGGPRELEPFADPRDDDGLVADEVVVAKSTPRPPPPSGPVQGDLFG